MKLLTLGVFLLCMILFVQFGQAFRLTDNLYFSITNNTIKCIDVILPDDSGFMGMGEFEYTLTCTSNWSDLSEQVIRTDENNTVRIPICFSGFGRNIGECSPPFRIGISSDLLGIVNEWSGGVCVSRYPDYDISSEEAEDEEGVRRILSESVDLFDVGFSVERMYSEPGKGVIYSLMVESYASLTIDLDVKNTNLGVTPLAEAIQTSSSDPYHTLYFTVQAPEDNGEYSFDIKAVIRNCAGSFCSKTATGKLVVNESVPETGFSVYLFPRSINVKELEPVRYTLTIQNHGKAKSFTKRIDIRPVTSTDFNWRGDITVLENNVHNISFTVTPEKISSLYEVEVTVGHEGIEKKASAALSTNEMLTDSMRSIDYINGLDPSLTRDANSAMDEWYDGYRSSEYGEDTGSYSSLKDSLAGIRAQAEQPAPDDPPQGPGSDVPDRPGTGDEDEDVGMWWLVPVIIIAAIAAVVLVVFFKKSKKTDENEGEYF